jgi:uncharacterized protein YcfJ
MNDNNQPIDLNIKKPEVRKPEVIVESVPAPLAKHEEGGEIVQENHDEHGSHPVATAIGAAGGGVAGATIGKMVGGRLGAAIGAVAGAVAGGITGNAAGESLDHTVEEVVGSR